MVQYRGSPLFHDFWDDFFGRVRWVDGSRECNIGGRGGNVGKHWQICVPERIVFVEGIAKTNEDDDDVGGID